MPKETEEKYREKTKEQLMEELEALRVRMAELERSEAERKQAEEEQHEG